MQAPWRNGSSPDYLTDAMGLLDGWTREGGDIRRTLDLDDTEHAALAEHIKIFADALGQQPNIRRKDGCTEIQVGLRDDCLESGAVAFAARIEDAYRMITGPRIDAA